MTTRFKPDQMRDLAGLFEVYAQTVQGEAAKMWASSQNIAGAGWSSQAHLSSHDTMGQVY
jgi:Proteins of 100 residues with WXG